MSLCSFCFYISKLFCQQQRKSSYVHTQIHKPRGTSRMIEEKEGEFQDLQREVKILLLLDIDERIITKA